MKIRWIVALISLLCVWGCATAYYGAMEKIGVYKRDIMMDRVKEARDAQNETKEQFLTAIERYKKIVHFQGGNLEEEYNQLRNTLERSESEANILHTRIKSVEEVSDALFEEWKDELNQYKSEALRRASRKKYDETQSRYRTMIAAMKKAEAKLEPVLVPLRDQVLFLKHNLNAQAIAGLSDEVVNVQGDVDRLVRDMDVAITEADKFIATLQKE